MQSNAKDDKLQPLLTFCGPSEVQNGDIFLILCVQDL